ncbi:MAG: DinB family protein [Flavobacteriales bacterium]|nr:DinB family protein [Flavobacteriales bacterium]
MNEVTSEASTSALTPHRRQGTPLIGHTRVQFDELHRLVSALNADQYTAPVPVLSKSSIGQHVRHVLEFYICLMNAGSDTVDYDSRKRDRALETDRAAVMGALNALRDWMKNIRQDMPMHLLVDHSTDGSGNTRMGTSLYRELAYAFDHGTHHMALLRIAVEQHHPGIALDPDFGVAPSTVRDRKNRNA